jgi:predicted transcriptional regulator
MTVIEVTTDFASIRAIARDNSRDREWLMRHAIHQLVKQYKREFGEKYTGQMLDEVVACNVSSKDVESA